MKSKMKPLTGALLTVLLAASAVAMAHGADDRKAGGAAKQQDHASALGRPGDAKKVSRTVAITMSDSMRFSPASVSAKRGETIRFVLKNEGKLKHEMVLGTALVVFGPGRHGDARSGEKHGQQCRSDWFHL